MLKCCHQTVRPSGGAVGVVSGAPSVGHPESNAHTHTHTNAHSLSLLVSLFFYRFLLFCCLFLFLLFAFGGRKGGGGGRWGFCFPSGGGRNAKRRNVPLGPRRGGGQRGAVTQTRKDTTTRLQEEPQVTLFTRPREFLHMPALSRGSALRPRPFAGTSSQGTRCHRGDGGKGG